MRFEKIYQSVIKDGPFGYACHEIIFNSEGKPADFRIVDHNKIYESLINLGSHSVTGKKISELSVENEKHRHDIIALYNRISGDGKSDKIEYYSDNLKHWYDVKVLKYNDGFLITLFEDITYLKGLQSELDNTGYLLIENERLTRLTKSLAESEESYKSLFDYTIVAIYVLDNNGIFLDVNSAATRMYGYDREEMIGYTPEKLSAPGRNDIEKTIRNIQQAFNGEPQRFEWWGLRKNGEVFPKDVVLNKGLYFGKDVVFAMARDNTELLQTLDALKESEDKFRTLTEQLPVGVYRTTIDGKIVYTNLALVRILDYNSVDEFLKINVNQLYTNPENRHKQLKNADIGAGTIQSEFQLKKKNGDLIWVRDNSRLIYDKKGNPEYFDGVLEDITEERYSQLKMKQISKL
jgi:PAS domain S-box-containing protein